MTVKTLTKSWQPQSSKTQPGYRDLVQALEDDIRSGRLEPGAKLPPHRELAASLGISRGTVARAYDEARRLGLLHCGTGQGTFVAHSFGVRARQALPDDEIDFGMAYPIYELDPDLGEILATLAQDPRRGELLRYPMPGGAPEQRTAGVRWCARLGVEVTADDLVVVAGGQHAIHMWLLAVLRPGDTLLTGRLTFPMAVAAAELRGLNVVGIAMDEEGVLPEALDEAARATEARGLYIMPSIQNPTTGVLSERRRRELIEVVRGHGLQVFEDDIHGPFEEPHSTPLKMLCPDRVTWVASLSKSVAGGLRAAYAAPPREFFPAYASALHVSLWSVSPLISEIASRWIRDGTAETVVARKREEGEVRLGLLREQLGPLAADLRTGAYFAWLTLPSPWTATAFTMEAHRRGVTVMPSEAFFVGDGSPPEAVRICLGSPSRDEVERGLSVLAELLARPGSVQAPIV